MTPEGINAAVAGYCGEDRWHLVKHGMYYRPHAAGYTGEPSLAGVWAYSEAVKLEGSKGYPDEVKAVRADPRDYYGSLDACYLMTGNLPRDRMDALGVWLSGILQRDKVLHDRQPMWRATSRQMCEAFLRAVHLWKDSPLTEVVDARRQSA